MSTGAAVGSFPPNKAARKTGKARRRKRTRPSTPPSGLSPAGRATILWGTDDPDRGAQGPAKPLTPVSILIDGAKDPPPRVAPWIGRAQRQQMPRAARMTRSDSVSERFLANTDLIAAVPPFPVNGVSPVMCAHARPKALLPGAFDFAIASRVVHRMSSQRC